MPRKSVYIFFIPFPGNIGNGNIICAIIADMPKTAIIKFITMTYIDTLYGFPVLAHFEAAFIDNNTATK
jgi:hypothetical protein